MIVIVNEQHHVKCAYKPDMYCWLTFSDLLFHELYVFKPPPAPFGSVRAWVRASVIHVVVLCFRDISSICWLIFAKLLSLVHLGTEMNWLHFGVKRTKGQSSRSHHRGGGALHSTLPSSATFSSSTNIFGRGDVDQIINEIHWCENWMC